MNSSLDTLGPKVNYSATAIRTSSIEIGSSPTRTSSCAKPCPATMKRWAPAPCPEPCPKPCPEPCPPPCPAPCPPPCQPVCEEPCQPVCEDPCQDPCEKSSYSSILWWIIWIFLAPVVVWIILYSFPHESYMVNNPCTNQCVIDKCRLLGISVFIGWIFLFLVWIVCASWW